MERFMTCINTNDRALAEELIAADAEFSTPVSKDKLIGGAGYLSVVEFMRKSFSDIRWEIVDMAAEDDKVAVSWICSGTHDGEFMGLAPTGKKFCLGTLTNDRIWTLDDEQVIHFVENLISYALIRDDLREIVIKRHTHC